MAATTRFLARKVWLACKLDLQFVQAEGVACNKDDIWGKLPGLHFPKTHGDRLINATAFLRKLLPN